MLIDLMGMIQFDRLLILSKGQCVYFGSTEFALDYFEDMWNPAVSNPADYIMSLLYELPETTEDENSLSVESLALRYAEFVENEVRNSTDSSVRNSTTNDIIEPADPISWSSYFSKQLMYVCIQGEREWIKEKRRLVFYKALSIRNVVLGVVVGKQYAD